MGLAKGKGDSVSWVKEDFAYGSKCGLLFVAAVVVCGWHDEDIYCCSTLVVGSWLRRVGELMTPLDEEDLHDNLRLCRRCVQEQHPDVVSSRLTSSPPGIHVGREAGLQQREWCGATRSTIMTLSW